MSFIKSIRKKITSATSTFIAVVIYIMILGAGLSILALPIFAIIWLWRMIF